MAVVALALSACREMPPQEDDIQVVQGEAQGSTYTIKYRSDDDLRLAKTEVDSILDAIDMSLSTWKEGSTISRFNREDTTVIEDAHFNHVFLWGREFSAITQGAFQPMIAPLVRAWGFGPEGGQIDDGANLDSLRALVHFDFMVDSLEDGSFRYGKSPGMQLDVNSYAQGYAVDVLVEYLEAKGIQHMMVEVGGELAARGHKAGGDGWRIGIDRPVEPGAVRELLAAVVLQDAAMATSGTYRKYYEKDGKRYAHAIDPTTGRPVEHNLLSVTVMAPTAMEADALATAFLVMGEGATLDFLEAHPDMEVEVYLISAEGEDDFRTYASTGWEEAVEEF